MLRATAFRVRGKQALVEFAMIKTPMPPFREGLVAVIGAGPAGLMAAEVLAARGHVVDVFDAMPSVGRKFLLAGRGGLNLTHAEDAAAFRGRFGAREALLQPMLSDFGAREVRQWAQELGIETFVGTSQRVFPLEMKAAPLLRAWLHRLRGAGVRFHARHRWTGWDAEGRLTFEAAGRPVVVAARACVMALGGASWKRLGSDGAWQALLEARGVAVAPLKPSNCGFDVQGGWSEHLSTRFAGQPLKPVALQFSNGAGQTFSRQGEFVLTGTGIEGSLVYAVSAMLRDEIEAHGVACLNLDLLPDRSLENVQSQCAAPRGSQTLARHLHRRLGLQGLKMALLHEVLDKPTLADPLLLARAIKSLPIRLASCRPIDEAISTAGGVAFEAMTPQLMLKAIPGVFCCGEMLDWEAPTGGYLLTACMATGRWAGGGLADWLRLANPD